MKHSVLLCTLLRIHRVNNRCTRHPRSCACGTVCGIMILVSKIYVCVWAIKRQLCLQQQVFVLLPLQYVCAYTCHEYWCPPTVGRCWAGSERVCSRVVEETKGHPECQVSTPSEWQKRLNQDFTHFSFKRSHLQSLSPLANRKGHRFPQ